MRQGFGLGFGFRSDGHREKVTNLDDSYWLGKTVRGFRSWGELASHTGVSLAAQAETKLPTWTGLHWTAATLTRTTWQTTSFGYRTTSFSFEYRPYKLSEIL